MKQEIWYTIHFEDAGTGENFDDGVYASIDELISSSAFDYPGYGSQTIKEIDRATALEMLVGLIDERVDEWLHDDAVDVDPEEYEIVEPKWFREVAEYIQYKEPGWQLLQEEYC